MRMLKRGLAAAAGLLTLVSLTVATASPGRADPPILPDPNSHGITLDSLTEVGGDPRMLDAVVSTAALYQPVHVRIYLPADYQSAPQNRYDSLYLLHGSLDKLDDALAWTDPSEGNLTSILAGSPFKGVVVMPEAGKAGWYTDWQKPDGGGRQPLWETFHINQLLPWIDDNFRTIADRDHRSIAGLSMGGFGALSYAARHPDLFSAVGAFSAASDIVHDTAAQQVIVANEVTLLAGSAITDAQQNDSSYHASDVQNVFGPYQSGSWEQHNPADQIGTYAANPFTIAMYAGNASDLIEGLVRGQSDKFHTQLNAAWVTHRYCAGSGTHSWPYWQGDLEDFLAVRYGTTPDTCPNGWGAPQQ